MKTRSRTIALLALAVLLCLAAPTPAARQILALFPPEILPAGADNTLRSVLPVLEQTLKEKLEDRFDVRPAGQGTFPATDESFRRRARALGASYVFTGNLSRIGKTVTLDVTIAPVEEPGKARTVVVSGALEDPSALTPRDLALFRRLGTEAALKAKYGFFGDERVGEGATTKNIPKLAGTIGRSNPMPGEMVSTALSDTDLDGKMELVAAYPDAIAVYRVEGDELREKARIPNAGPGLFHVDAADVNRNGVADIVAVRYSGGKALSDIWEFDGKGYRKISSDLPYFLRTADLGWEGIVLLAQASDPVKIYQGPVFRIGVNRYGQAEVKDRDRHLPLPGGTFLYGFTSLRKGKEVRYAVLTARNRLVYLDEAGKELWEGLDAVTGTELTLEGADRRLQVPGRMAAVDLDRDGVDELVVLNDLVAAGTYFENLRVFSQAEILCFAQGDTAMQLAWRSPQLEASARDLLAVRLPSPGPVRFAVASRDRGKILGAAAQWRVLWVK
ncbi:MAG TPA: VCBS repeat-containing protein [Candidatus Methylomirabilis sp.]|nr:VCBS repeat-containing protein [Candidatus Methylomirabilis sp.]